MEVVIDVTVFKLCSSCVDRHEGVRRCLRKDPAGVEQYLSDIPPSGQGKYSMSMTNQGPHGG